MKIYCLQVTENEYENASALLKLLPAARSEKIKKIKSESAKALSLFASLLSRMAISTETGAEINSITFSADKNNKPIIVSPAGIHFNVSHTPGMVICATSDRPVGIDVERVDRKVKILERILSDNERKDICSGQFPNHSRYIEIWTKKEAITKCSGDGILSDLKSIDTLSPEFSNLFTFSKGDYIISVYSEDTDISEISDITVNDCIAYFDELK